ncbi:hypothetical protein SAMD00019534_016490, partial [Acytostelium subglobosum LB1]|uniref:hypothetical protein n=1 Tax=Acytostelium subglobosum LB1 TaxID=1410327 RepID=UPI000644C16E
QTLDCAQMQSLADSTFGGGQTSTNFICIAFYESSWNPNAENSGSSASGLWQILPEHCGELCPACTTPSDLFDPSINAQCALAVYNAQGYDAWTTWSSGDCTSWTQCSASGSSSGGSAAASSSGTTTSGTGSSGQTSSTGTSSSGSSGSSGSTGSSSSGSGTAASN